MRKENLWQAALVLIGALASAYAGYLVANQPEQPGVIQYVTDNDDGLKRLFGSSSDLRLSYKGIPQTDISRASLLVLNKSKRAVENVRIYIEPNSKTRPAIAVDFDVPRGYPREIVKALPGENGVYPFDIKYINRGEGYQDAFRFTLYFIGSNSPKLEATIDAKGHILQKQDSLFDRSSFILFVLKDSWWVFAVYIGVVAGYLRYGRTQRAIQEVRASEIVEGLIGNPPSPETDRQVYIKDIADRLLKSPKFSEVLKSIFKESQHRGMHE